MKIFVLGEKLRSTILLVTLMSTDAQNTGKTPVSRTMVFLSHAAPEDNVFTRWLALQVANEGYPVWCDLTKLLGGEAFWEDIQIAIKERTAKFLFVTCIQREEGHARRAGLRAWCESSQKRCHQGFCNSAQDRRSFL